MARWIATLLLPRFLVLLPTLLVPTALAAQDQSRSAEDMVQTAKDAYGPSKPKPRCDKDSQDPDVIVVCGELEDQEQFRVRSDEQAEKDYADRTKDRDKPKVPSDLIEGDGIFKGPATVSGICGIGLSSCPPPPALIIDLDEIPTAPEGSDADLIGKGEKAQ